MRSKSIQNILLVAVILTVAGAKPARAQAPLEPSQLPARTMFYLIWRGAPAADVRKANSLLGLWDDTDFASVRSAMAAGLLSSSEQKSSQNKLTPEELGDFAGLLENSFTLGYVTEPAKHRAANLAASAEGKFQAWNGMFFVYDRTGKEALISKAILRMRSQETETPRLSQVTIAGVQVLKVERKTGANYWAENGKYAISASEASVMEDLIDRLGGKTAGASSLSQSTAYQEAQSIVGGGVLEFFLRIPDLKEFAEDSKPGGFQAGPLLDAARLDAVHSVSGRVTFEGARTHVQAAILGDAAPGTPFDIWSAGQPVPASLALVPADAISFNSAQLDLLGMYGIIKRVARAAFPQGQQGNADLLETMAQTRLGMPLADALGLFTGEFDSMQTSPSLDTTKQVFFVAIRKKPETLKLFRSLFGDQLASERNEGETTFLKISLGGNQGNAGVAQWNFFHLAVMPDMILAASRIDTLREVLANRAKGSAFSSLSSVPRFQAGRKQFPQNLDGLSYFDFQKVDWQAAKDHWLEEARKSSVAKSVAGTNASTSSSKIPDWLANANPELLPRHLHYSSSVTWKDAKGIHWDQWLE